MFFPNLELNKIGKIAPVENIPPSTEGEVIPNEKVDTKSPLHLLSVFSGAMLASIVAGTFCYIPISNVFEKPDKWYEFHFILLSGPLHLFLAQILLLGYYWANFRFIQWRLYLYLNTIGVFVYCMTQIIYYVYWVHYLNFDPPMPLNLYIGGTASFVSVFLALWFRFV